MKNLAGFRILPVLMVIAAICFGVRFSQVMAEVYKRTAGHEEARYISNDELAAMETSAGEAPAKQPSSAELKDSATPPEAPKVEEKKEETAAATAPPPGKPVIEPPSLGKPPKPKTGANWKAADDLDDEYSDVKMEMFADLSKRRKDLDAKEKELVMREALIKAAQAELTQKTDELTQIKADIEALLKKQTEQEDQRIASLVKIYEGMKAKDAARIFDSLEMDVLLQVMTKMSERKSAPILAAMDPAKARSVTILLAEQNKLPEMPPLPVPQ